MVGVEVVEGNVMASAPVTLRIGVRNFGATSVARVPVSLASTSMSRTLPPIDAIAATRVQPGGRREVLVDGEPVDATGDVGR